MMVQHVFIDWRDYSPNGPWPKAGDRVTIPQQAHENYRGREGVVVTAKGAKQTVKLDA